MRRKFQRFPVLCKRRKSIYFRNLRDSLLKMNTESTIQMGSARQSGADQNFRFHNLRPASPPGGVEPLPHSTEAEIALQGCLLLDPAQAFPVVAGENIGADHFYDMRHGKLFCLLRKLYRANGTYDTVVVINALRDAGELDALGGPPMLSSMINNAPSAAADVVRMYIDVLKDKKRRRFMIDVAQRLQQLARDVSAPSAPLLEEMVEQVRGLERMNSREKNLSLRTPAEVLALPSDQQDNILGDRLLAKGQSLTLVGAGGIGKSRLLLQLAVSCILGRPFIGMKTHARNLRWLIFQAENSVRRLQRDLSALQSWTGNQSDWNEVNERLLIHTLENSGDCFLNLDDPRTRLRIADVIERHEADVICFDPLNAFGAGDLNTDHDMRLTCRAITEIAQGANPAARHRRVASRVNRQTRRGPRGGL